MNSDEQMDGSECCSDGDFELEADAAPDEPPECAVCTDAYWEPLSLPGCNHTFCRHCIMEVVRRHTDINLPRCPLCRVPIVLAPAENQTTLQWLAVAPLNDTIDDRLRLCFPAVWERRQAEAELRKAGVIPLSIGHRCNAPQSQRSDASWTLFVEVVAPTVPSALVSTAAAAAPAVTGSPTAAAEAAARDATAMLIECVHFALPPEHEAGSENVVEVQDLPLEVHGTSAIHSMEEGFPVPITVIFKRRLRMEPLLLVHRMGLSGSGSSARHEVALPEGLTLARVLARTRPKARVGVGTAHEAHVF